MAADANSGYFIEENGTTIMPALTEAWSGAYGGVFAGVGAFTGRVMDWDYYSQQSPDGDVDLGDISGLAGVQAGWNWRHGDALLGIEADWAWTDFDQGRYMNNGFQYGLARMDWLATLRGRIGVVSGNALAYATGGLAAARVKHCANLATPCSHITPENVGWEGTEFGLAAGAGIETRLDENWSLKAEYLFAGFGDRYINLETSSGSPVALSDWSHQIRLGLNFHPGGLPYAEPANGDGAWNGFYGGVHAGIGHFTGGAIGWDDVRPFNNLVGDVDLNAFAGLGGVQAGVNWQDGQVLYGIEADYSASGYNEARKVGGNKDQHFQAELGWQATLRARLGMVAGNGMAYVTGGMAIAGQKHCANDDLICETDNDDDIAWDGTTLGLAAGAGVEARLADNWSLKAEYLFVRMQPENLVFNDAEGSDVDFQNHSHQFRLGLNYHFNGLPYSEAEAMGQWNGFHAGLHGGGGLFTGMAIDWNDTAFSSPSGDMDQNALAGLAGAQIGFDRQVGNLVYGLESDWAWTGFSEGQSIESRGYVQADLDWLATLRGRLGVANGNAMFYATAGLALAELHHCGSRYGTGNEQYCHSNNEDAVEWDGLKLGLAAGAGAEILLDDHWSVKGEYLFVQMDKESVTYDTNEGYEIDFSNRSHLFRVGVNYRFGG